MASGPTSDPSRVGRPEGLADDGARLRRFLRSGQIFAAAVRESVDSRCLTEAFPHSLTLPQLYLLKIVAHDGDHRVSDVAAFLGVSSPAATKCVDKLERLGLISRRPSTSDRRSTTLSVSEEGRRVVLEYERIKKERLKPILAGFELREIDQLSELLERFAVALHATERPSRDSCLWCGAYIDDDCAIARVRGGCPCRNTRSSHSTEAEMT